MLEFNQIQSNVLRGYRQGEAPKYVQYVFLRCASATALRGLLRALHEHVTSCAAYDQEADAGGRRRKQLLRPKPGIVPTLNIGLSYAALELLGLGGNARALDERDHEATGAIEAFKCGMIARAEILGDRGPSRPAAWEPAYREVIHLVISLAANKRKPLAKLRGIVDDAIAAAAGQVTVVTSEAGKHFDGPLAGKEHFGFLDGIAQPAVLGSGLSSSPGDGTPRKRRGWDPVASGEFVLGEIDESGNVQFGSPLFKYGSFMVFRKLQQHVDRFRAYTAQVGQRHGLSAEAVGAKMIGRWPSGAPLVLSPKQDNPKLGADPERNNDFRYADDADGQRCPFGAHIRRNNPREDPSGPQVSQTRLHRVIRRATPYGDWLPDGQADDGKDRGTLFVVINADISRQFEFIQNNWVDGVLSSTHLTLPEDRDPLIGAHTDERMPTSKGKLVIPSSARRKPPVIAWELPNFVTTRGGGYFLLPSLSTLYDIAFDIKWPANGDACGAGSSQPSSCASDVETSPTPTPSAAPTPSELSGESSSAAPSEPSPEPAPHTASGLPASELGAP